MIFVWARKQEAYIVPRNVQVLGDFLNFVRKNIHFYILAKILHIAISAKILPVKHPKLFRYLRFKYFINNKCNILALLVTNINRYKIQHRGFRSEL